MPPLKVLLPILLIVFGGIGYYFYSQKKELPQAENIKALVKKGEFKVKVTATGELKAKRSEKIRGPQGMRTAQIWQTNITDMIPEGTLPKATITAPVSVAMSITQRGLKRVV